MIRQPRDCREASPSAVAATLASLATVGPYFTVTTGEPGPGRWRPTGRLYDDPEALAAVVTHVGAQIGSDERRVCQFQKSTAQMSVVVCTGFACVDLASSLPWEPLTGTATLPSFRT